MAAAASWGGATTAGAITRVRTPLPRGVGGVHAGAAAPVPGCAATTATVRPSFGERHKERYATGIASIRPHAPIRISRRS
jgi:uncharacterized protein YraI